MALALILAVYFNTLPHPALERYLFDAIILAILPF